METEKINIEEEEELFNNEDSDKSSEILSKEEETEEEKQKDGSDSNMNKNKQDEDCYESDDDLSMFDDDDDDDVNGKLYGQKRRRPDFSTGAPPGSFEMYALNWKEMEDRKIRHHEVIRKILAEFDIEEVKERYRGRGIIRDFSHANRKFRLWLEKMMGNDKVQLSDRKWHELFRQKVNEDYEHKLKERERQLADAEVQRLQRLRLQGILASDDSRDTTEGHRKNSRSKKKSLRSYNDHSSKHQHLYTRPLDDIETQMEIINKSASPRSKASEKSIENMKETQEDEDHNRKTKEEENDDVNEDEMENDTSSASRQSNNGHLGMSGIVRPDRNPELQSLYREENLHQLYAHAEKMIRPTS